MAAADEKKAGFSSAIDKQTRLCSWGANGHGQLGIGSKDDQLLPVSVKVEVKVEGEDDSIVQVGGGGGFSYILLASGAIQTCGNNDRGQLGQGEQPLHEDILTLCDVRLPRKIVQLAAGWDFMLALCGDGAVLSWGSNAFAQLGRDLEHPNTKYSSSPAPVKFPDNISQTSVAAGLRHALSLTDNGSIFAWGHGRKGQLGSQTTEGKVLPKSDSPVAVQISNAEPIASLFAGMYHSGALTLSGSLFLWGCNKYGQCCITADSTSMIHLPTKAHLSLKEVGEKLVSVSTGWTHVVARSDQGRLYSWGRADFGQLGRQCDGKNGHIPTSIDGIELVKKHECGTEHNLAVTYDGSVYAWGWNEHGICATGNEENVPYPKKVSSLKERFIEDVSCGTGHSFCIEVEKPPS